MRNVFTLYSSARKNGNTFEMTQAFSNIIPSEVCYLDDLDVREYDYQHTNQHDDFEMLIDKMLAADIIIFASPVYWYSMTPAFKRFFDRFTDLTELIHLKAKGKALRKKSFYLFLTSVHDQPPKAFVNVVKDTFNYFKWQYAGLEHVKCESGFDHDKACEQLELMASGLFSTSTEASLQTVLGEQSRSLSKFK